MRTLLIYSLLPVLLIAIYIYNKDKQVDSGTFEFTRYSDYEDEDEFQQHLNRCIDEFVDYF